MHETVTPSAPTTPGARLGERVRTLRVSAGLTQTQLAGERFSKEYISQIERGKTRPTEATVAWLAERLGVDPALLSSGISTDHRAKVEAALDSRRGALRRAAYEEAVEAYREIRPSVAGTAARSLELRVLTGEAWALQEVGQVKEAIELLLRAREIVERDGLSDLELADVLYRLAVCRYKLSSISTAIALFDEALDAGGAFGPAVRPASLGHPAAPLALPSPASRLRAAHDDVERALELAQDLGDRSAIANAYFQASLLRSGRAITCSRAATRSGRRSCTSSLNDERNVGRLLLMLGGLTLLLGDEDSAVEHLKASYSRALDTDSPADAAQALEGIARVHLNRGEYDQAEGLARKALELLQGREDYLHEVCPSQLVLGRALMERGRLEEAEECFRAADAAAEQLASISHRTEAWVALGDLAARQGHDREAARLYRNAAEALQEIRF